MAEYQIINENVVLRIADMIYIPNDPNNYDWVEYQTWRSKGNIPDGVAATPAKKKKRK